MHGEKEKPRCGLADVVYIQILRHRAGHGQLDGEDETMERKVVKNRDKPQENAQIKETPQPLRL